MAIEFATPEINKYLPTSEEVFPIINRGERSEQEMQDGYESLLHILATRSNGAVKIVYKVAHLKAEIGIEELDKIKSESEEKRKKHIHERASDLYWADKVFLISNQNTTIFSPYGRQTPAEEH